MSVSPDGFLHRSFYFVVVCPSQFDNAILQQRQTNLFSRQNIRKTFWFLVNNTQIMEERIFSMLQVLAQWKHQPTFLTELRSRCRIAFDCYLPPFFSSVSSKTLCISHFVVNFYWGVWEVALSESALEVLPQVFRQKLFIKRRCKDLKCFYLE